MSMSQEPMSPERLEHLRRLAEMPAERKNSGAARVLHGPHVTELLNEVERLRDVQATLVDGGTYTSSQLNRIARIVQRADLLHHHVVEAGPDEEPPTLDSVIHAIRQILVEDEPVKNAFTIVWRELIGGMLLRSEQQLREMAERDRDEARAELERVGGMTAAEVLAWRAER